jgi:tetratricopeptide (TPR) repeat protein
VIVRLDELIRQIDTDQTQQQHQKLDEALPMSVFKSSEHAEGQSSTGLNGQFIHSQLLIDCLVRMKPSSNEKQEFITFCKQHYKDNPADLEVVEEFERDYVAKKALLWYTRHSFLFRLLNKALRVQNIDLLYLFRFFIRDLKQELENKKCSSPVHVYRAQRMSKDEIKMLQKSFGEYVSMNSFLSTSIDREQARSFFSFDSLPDDVEEVFFKIDADPHLDNIKPFGNITSVSYFPDEGEVLFMIGSIFQVVEMKHGSDRIWNIRILLCSENDHQLKSLFQHMKKELGTGTTNLFEFGRVIYGMGKLNEAEKYFRLYLDGLPAGDPSIANCYQALGMVADDRGEYDSSLKWYGKALDIAMKTMESNHRNIAIIHNCIGEVHRKKHDNALALESYEKALIIQKKEYGEDHPRVAMCLNNMGGVYQQLGKYSKALEYYQRALVIDENHLPAEHPQLGGAHNNIGIIHRHLGNYDKALKHLNLSLQIKLKSLPPQHPDIAQAFASIGFIYEAKHDFEQALSYFEKAVKIFRHSLSPAHPNVIKINEAIGHVSSKLK